MEIEHQRIAGNGAAISDRVALVEGEYYVDPRLA